MIGSVILIIIAVILIIKTSNVKPDIKKDGSAFEKRYSINHIYGSEELKSGEKAQIIITDSIRMKDLDIDYQSITKVQNYALFLDREYDFESINFDEKNENKKMILTDFLEILYEDKNEEKCLIIADLSGKDMVANILQKIVLFAARFGKINLMCNSIRHENSYLYNIKNQGK